MKTVQYEGLTLSLINQTIRTLGYQQQVILALAELPELETDKSLDRLAFAYANWLSRLKGAEGVAWYCNPLGAKEDIQAAFLAWVDEPSELYAALKSLADEPTPKNS
jgi:hypothetical protein